MRKVANETSQYSFRELYLTTLWRFRRRGILTYKGNWKPDTLTFYTWHKRPKFAAQLEIMSRKPKGIRAAVVMQGPVVTKENFTIETVKLLKAFYPETHVIVSTWAGLDSSVRFGLEDAGAILLESEKPERPGPSNVNLQMTSTVAGIQLAKKLGADTILKIRTDIRIYEPRYLEYLTRLLEVFPLGSDLGGQHSRLIAVSEDTFLNRKYGLGDFVMFGESGDMEKYWSHETVKAESMGLESFLEATPETFFCSKFLKKVGIQISDDFAIWKSALTQRFIVVDASSLDLLWKKYSDREYYFKTYSKEDKKETLTFAGWLALGV